MQGLEVEGMEKAVSAAALKNDLQTSQTGGLEKNSRLLSEPEERERERKALRFHSMSALYRKEMADHISSKRFVIILAVMAALTVASVYGSMTGIRSELADSGSSMDLSNLFLRLYTTSGGSIPSYMSLIALIGPFIGIILGFDAINSERNSGTLNRLVAQPIYRDSIIIGKFLASATLIGVLVLCSGITVGTAGFLFSGIRPSGEAVMRVLIYLLYTVVYICFWQLMALLFSVFTRYAATSALLSIALWLFFAIFVGLLAGVIANGVYPVNTDYEQSVNMIHYYNLNLGLNRVSPYYLYSEASTLIMDPARSTMGYSYAQIIDAYTGFLKQGRSYLSLGQSLLLVWPHLVGLIALCFFAFETAYVGFMRQEVRGN